MKKTKKITSSEKKTPSKKYSVKSITYTLCGVVVLGILISTIASSIQVMGFLKEELRTRIGDTALIMARNIDVQAHSKIRTLDDENRPEFQILKNNLQTMREQGFEIANAYTMRKRENGNIIFIVDGSVTNQNRIGDVYPSESVSDVLLDVFTATPENWKKRYVEPDTYADAWGDWMSAYAPIFTSTGELDSIIGIDVSAASIRQHEFKYLITICISSILIIIITLPLVFRLMRFIHAITDELKQANKDFQRLLDNSGQGFLSFGSDLVIEHECSRACETIFGRMPAGEKITYVFFQDDPIKIELFSSVVQSVLNESDELIRESMLSLLPENFERNGMTLDVKYKILDDQKFMVILTDVTAERSIANQLEKERLNLELVVMAVSDSRNFFDTVNGFESFLFKLPELKIESAPLSVFIKTLYREIHTFKGLLSQFSFPATPKVLHSIESYLSQMLALDDELFSRDDQETTEREIIASILSTDLEIAFESDLSIISRTLGDDFLINGEGIVLTYSQALQLEKLAAQLLRGETVDTNVEIQLLLKEISKLRKVSFKNVLASFDGVIQKTAKRMKKAVATLVVKGGEDIWIYPQDYKLFFRSLIHIFRNCVTHGIESPETRWEIEKDEVGEIICNIDVIDGKISMIIADDGAGINVNMLRQRIVENGVRSKTELDTLSDDEVMQFIFKDNISTSENVWELAGRGVGLASVQNETENLGGTIVVKAKEGKGTQFIFTLPLQTND